MVNGKRIRFIDQGQGPVVLLIHGGAGSIEDWEPTRALLSKRHRVLVIDRPGHGHSDRVEGKNLLIAQADAIADFLKQQAGEPAILVGHSYGGGVALALVVRHPDQVRGVVHVAGVGASDRHKENPTAYCALLRNRILRRPVAELVGRIAARVIIRQTLEKAFDPESSYLTQELLEREFALWSQPRNQISHTLQLDQIHHDLVELWPLWASIRAPVFLLAGGGDRLVSPDEARDLFKHIPDAGIRIIPNAGHMLPITQPKAIAAAVASIEQWTKGHLPTAIAWQAGQPK